MLPIIERILNEFGIDPHKEEINYHGVLIEAPAGMIAEQAFLWGEASWWPALCKMQFRRMTSGGVKLDAEYEMRLRYPLLQPWQARVTKLIPGQEIERTFFSGIFKGRETVAVEERYNATKVSYTMSFRVKGILPQILWKLHFRRVHDANLRMILDALKEYCLKQLEEKRAQ